MKVMCVVAHQDDEVLGVGGTLARHVKEGAHVQVLVVCANSFRRQKIDGIQQMLKATEKLGIRSEYICCLGKPDQMLDQVSIVELEKQIREFVPFQPEIWYTHWHKDLNRDHRMVSEAVQLIARPNQGRKFEVREFPTPSSSEYNREPFVPDTWVDITATLQQKMDAIECYESELQPFPMFRNPQSLEYLARVRGGEVGLAAAEVFATARRIL